MSKVIVSEDSNSRILESAYTIYEDKAINEAIGRQVLEFTRKILARVKDIQSLHLLGGYGRGEGSILQEKEVVPLGDYDFLAVTRLPHTNIEISGFEELQRRFRVQYHVGVDFIWKPLLRFLNKRIYWYEAKFGSKRLLGDQRSLDEIPISSGADIDIREGFHLMFNRLAGLEIVFNPTLQESDVLEEQKRHLIFQSIKATLACGESLLLLCGKYHFSYAERRRRFLKESEGSLADFSSLNPHFKSDYAKATDFKLKPSFSMYADPIKNWFAAKKQVLQTLVFFLSKTRPCSASKQISRSRSLNTQVTPENFPKLYLNESKPEMLDYLKYNWNAFKHFKSLRNISQFQNSFSDNVHVCLYYLALSTNDDGEIDCNFLDEAARVVGRILPISKKTVTEKNLHKKWQLIRDCAITAWRLARQ